MNQPQSLYQQLLGERYALLPEVLREFHAQSGALQASGVVSVTRGAGWLRRTAAALLQLPPVGEEVPLLLTVDATPDHEVWRRSFAGKLLVTRQWREEAELVEQSGPVAFRFQVLASRASLTFEPTGCRVLGIPLPRFLAPHVRAVATARATSWEIEVVIGLPLLGTITTYRGEITPQP